MIEAGDAAVGARPDLDGVAGGTFVAWWLDVDLEANGGWIVTWLERLDHHVEHFSWDAPYLKLAPSEYFRRQCWISFDPDESALPFTANSPLCGADRIVWASDYPHPDAKYPGVTDELVECIESLTEEQQRQIAGDNTTVLYGL